MRCQVRQEFGRLGIDLLTARLDYMVIENSDIALTGHELGAYSIALLLTLGPDMANDEGIVMSNMEVISAGSLTRLPGIL